MTTKELDVKLAKDVARIRIAAGQSTSSNIGEEMVKVMITLNDSGEGKLAKEISAILASAETMKKVSTVMTEQYLKTVGIKLKIRHAARKTEKPPRAYTTDDMNDALRIPANEVSRGADLIKKAIAAGETEAVLNASVAEAFNYDTGITLRELTKLLPLVGPMAIDLEIIEFMSLATEAIEYNKKELYYKKWIFEKFQPIGIIKVSITT